MIDHDAGIDQKWQVKTIQFMCRTMVYFEEPEEIVQAWFDEAGAGDEAHLRCAMRLWRQISGMAWHEVQRLNEEADIWMRVHG